MVDVAAIAGVTSALNAALNISKTMLGVRDQALMQAHLIELNREIIAAQQSAMSANAAQSALLKQVGDLEEEVAGLKAWGAEKEKYQLADVSAGVTAYALKEDAQGTEPKHHLCANCYADGKKSFLQPITRFPGRSLVWECHRCGCDIYIQGSWESSHAARKKTGR